MTNDNRTGCIDRRTYLKTGALLAGGALLPRTATADSTMDEHRHEGESASVGGGTVGTYATTDSDGELSSVGVHIDGDAFAAFDEGGAAREEPFAAHLHFPEETEAGDPIELGQFTFSGFHYNPRGHAPPGIYTVPHFDFHFNMMGAEDVEAIRGGPLPDDIPFIGLADYDLPEGQIPPGYEFEEHRLIVQEMGEHLLDMTAPEFHGTGFTHTNVYGLYDSAIDPESPDGSEVIELEGEELELPVYRGDGEGRLHFVEPMITTDYISNELDEETTVGIATPAVFPEAGEYPTTYVMEPDGDGGVFVSMDNFLTFPGGSE